MSVNPIDDDSGSVLVLVDDEKPSRLWLTFADVPTGWRSSFATADRAACPATSNKTRPTSVRGLWASDWRRAQMKEMKPTSSAKTTGWLVNTC